MFRKISLRQISAIMPLLNLSERSLKYPETHGLIWRNIQYTWHALHKRIAITAAALKVLGIEEGERVAVLGAIDQKFPELLFALLKIKAIAVPLRPDQPELSMIDSAEAASCRRLIAYNKRLNWPASWPIRVLSEEAVGKAKKAVSSADLPSLPLSFSAEQPATVLFTSGSGGKPKGILHTVGNHYFSALGANRYMPLGRDDRWLIVLPFFHVAGIAILFRTLIAGACSVIGDHTQTVVRQITEKKISHVSLVPTQLQRLLDDKKSKTGFPTLKAVLTGGSPCPVSLTKKALEAGLPLFLSYGSTEMASQITTAAAQELTEKPLSSGKLLPYRCLKIAENGEILVGGKTCGSLVDSDENVHQSFMAGEWYHSGDTGVLDQEGNLFMTGRLDNMFISGGENIHPEEIEKALLDLDKVMDACVVDVPDKTFGAKPFAFVRLETNERIDGVSLRAELENILPRFKIPIAFVRWNPEPGRLKPDRKALRQQAMTILKKT